MNIWKSDGWKKIYEGQEVRSGLRVRFEEGVDEEVKEAFKDFCKWLRKEYIFPVRIIVYARYDMKIMARDGELVFGTFWGPYDMLEEPYIRISVGDYCSKKAKEGKREVLISYLYTIVHELTHYFQWINQIKLTELGEERQATICAGLIVDDYIRVKEKEKYDLLEKIEDKAYVYGIEEQELSILEELSFDENPNVRGTVAQLLRNSEGEKEEQILRRLAHDKDSFIRAEACYSLGFSKSFDTYEVLKNIAKKDRNSTARGYAILSMEEIAVKIGIQEELIQFLENRLVDEKVVYTRINICAVLYNLGVAKYLNDVLDLINTKSRANRYIVVDYLCDIVNKDNRETILSALTERKKIEQSKNVVGAIDRVLKIHADEICV